MRSIIRRASALATTILFALPLPTSAAEKEGKDLKEGDAAPDFKAMGDDGKLYSLQTLRGKSVVLYFYPKDDTSGCTLEAQQFRDDADKYATKSTVVLGVSLDDAESHKAFRAKHKLNFPLLVSGKAIAEAYGVPTRFGLASRQTFVIGPDGKLKKLFRSVTAKGHSGEVLQSL